MRTRAQVWIAMVACAACSSGGSTLKPIFGSEDAATGNSSSGGNTQPSGASNDAGDSDADSAAGDAGDAANDVEPAGNPCANVPSIDNGTFCATTTQFGFDPQDADGTSIYKCDDGETSSVTACPNGCSDEPMGTPDKCN